MYLQYYGLTEDPFSLNPDPDFLYLGDKHQAAYSRMECGLLNQAPFSVLTGDVGMGKTVIIRRLINLIQSDNHYTVGFMTNTQLAAKDLLRWILFTFNLDCPENDKAKAHQVFYDFLINEYANNRQVVLIVDEAQNLDVETLERLRLLSNINADKHQVLQTFLVGQEGLQEMLKKPELKQFAQRITYSYHLEPFSRLETHAYILHRLAVAGGKNRKIFSIDACDRVFHYSQSTPRLINALCDAAMVYGFSDELELIDSNIIEEIVKDKRKGHILPLSDQAFVPEDQASSEIDALYAEIDKNTVRQIEGLSSEHPEQTESRLPEPDVIFQGHPDQQVEVDEAEDVEILPAAETIILHRPRDPGGGTVKEHSGIHSLTVVGGLVFLVIFGVFLWNFDTNRRENGTELQVEKKEIANYADPEISVNQALLDSDSEKGNDSDDSSMITVKVAIPEQTELSDRVIEREKISAPMVGLEKDDTVNKDELVSVLASINKTIIEKDYTEQPPVQELEVKKPDQTSLIPDQENVIDKSIEQVKDFFQFLTPEAEAPRNEKIRVVVKQGDTLTNILIRETGEFKQESLNKVLRENPGIEDVDRIYIGQVIYITSE